MSRSVDQHHHEIKAGDDSDPNFDRKLDIITAGAKPFVKEHLLTKMALMGQLVVGMQSIRERY